MEWYGRSQCGRSRKSVLAKIAHSAWLRGGPPGAIPAAQRGVNQKDRPSHRWWGSDLRRPRVLATPGPCTLRLGQAAQVSVA